MQIKSQRTVACKSWRIDDHQASATARSRFEALKAFWRLRDNEGCSMQTITAVLGVSRATLYRWQRAYRQRGLVGLEPCSKAPRHRRRPTWSRSLEQHVLKLRRRFPTWGKRPIAAVLKRDYGLNVSTSMVGRILKALLTRKKICPVAFHQGRVKVKKARRFNGHAKRWHQGLKATKPGELLQIDHACVNLESGRSVKHFEASCPLTKVTGAQVYSRATARTARQFLKHLQKTLPFPIYSIQVDGGSEFRAEFETACEKEGIDLYVLPPRCPELNGCVERRHQTLKTEFYALYQGGDRLSDVHKALNEYLNIYNNYRPHQSLNMDTPLKYYKNQFQEAA